MSYRFTLNSQPVECDTLPELLAATNSGGKTPGNKTTRARKSPTQQKTAKRGPRGGVVRPEPNINNGGAARSWALAKALADHRKIGIREARGLIAQSPRIKAAAERALVKSQSAQ